MPAKYLATWEPNQKLWRKTYRKVAYVVSCRQLAQMTGKPVPETKEGSYLVANQWWRETLAKLQAGQPHPHQDYIDDLSRRREWSRRRGEHYIAALLTDEIARIENGGVPYRARGFYEDEKLENPDPHPVVVHHLPKFPQLDESTLKGALWPNDAQWKGRLESIDLTPVAPEKTVKAFVTLWLKSQEVRVTANQLTAGRYKNLTDDMRVFQEFHGENESIETLNAGALERYFHYLLDMKTQRMNDPKKKAGWSDATANARFSSAKLFIRWCYRQDAIPLPKNIDAPELQITVEEKKKQHFTTQEVRTLVENADGWQLQLHLLLALNCGFTQQDVSDLQDDEVDWIGGTITRRRSKTRHVKSDDIPTVTYKLWSITFDLLTRYRSGEMTVLLTEKNKSPWVVSELVDGRVEIKDSIGAMWTKLKDRLRERGIKMRTLSLKHFRKTSANLLYNSTEFRPFHVYFLGHSSRTIAERHYVAVQEEAFERVVMWLGREYGFVQDGPERP